MTLHREVKLETLVAESDAIVDLSSMTRDEYLHAKREEFTLANLRKLLEARGHSENPH